MALDAGVVGGSEGGVFVGLGLDGVFAGGRTGGGGEGLKSEATRPQKPSSDSGGVGGDAFCFARMVALGKHGGGPGCGGVFEGGVGVVAKGDGYSLCEGGQRVFRLAACRGLKI